MSPHPRAFFAAFVLSTLVAAGCASSTADPAATGGRQPTAEPTNTPEPEPTETPDEVETADPDTEAEEPIPSFALRPSREPAARAGGPT